MFNVKYLENVERYDVGLKGCQMRNHLWAIIIGIMRGIMSFDLG